MLHVLYVIILYCEFQILKNVLTNWLYLIVIILPGNMFILPGKVRLRLFNHESVNFSIEMKEDNLDSTLMNQNVISETCGYRQCFSIFSNLQTIMLLSWQKNIQVRKEDPLAFYVENSYADDCFRHMEIRKKLSVRRTLKFIFLYFKQNVPSQNKNQKEKVKKEAIYPESHWKEA